MQFCFHHIHLSVPRGYFFPHAHLVYHHHQSQPKIYIYGYIHYALIRERGVKRSLVGAMGLFGLGNQFSDTILAICSYTADVLQKSLVNLNGLFFCSIYIEFKGQKCDVFSVQVENVQHTHPM